jgi:hypothetical protein
MCAIAFITVGAHLETRIGSCKFLFYIILFTITAGAIQILITWGLFTSSINSDCFNANWMGIAPVVFALEVLSITLDPEPRSLFGVLTIPARIYPWVNLVISHFMFSDATSPWYSVPNLAGILAGYAVALGPLSYLVPSTGFFIWIENSLPSMKRSGGYVLADGPIVRQYDEEPPPSYQFRRQPPPERPNYFQGRGRRLGD